MQVFVGILCGAMFNGWAGDFGYLCAAEKIDISNRHSTNCYHDRHQTASAIALQLFSDVLGKITEQSRLGMMLRMSCGLGA